MGTSVACIGRVPPGDFEDVARGPGERLRGRAVGSPMVVEEKPICRQAIAHLVDEAGGFAPAQFAASLAEAVELAARAEHSLLLVDLFTIGFDFEGLRRLVCAGRAAVIAIDDRPNPAFAGLAQQAGARGYACKSFEIEAFRTVLRTVMGGGSHFPSVIDARRSPPRAARSPAGLSPRQLEVLKCIAVGMSNQEIARSLGITAGTAKLHTHAILRLTGSRNRTEAALIAGRFVAPAMGE